MKNIKIVALFSILLCLLVIVPAAFASENVTSEDNNLTADYYFDSNIENDTGDGSITHPYRNFNSSNVKDNSVVHFANGEYDLGYVSKRNLTVVGQDPSKTVLTYGRFDVSSSLTLKNVTLNTISISNSGTITAQNTIFSNSSSTSGGVISSKSANSAITLNNCTFIHNSATEKGGAISSNGANSVVTLNNCTFIHNSATEKGGAIWMNGGNLNINDSIFEDNYAQGFGGSIASEKNALITIKKSKFLNGGSQKDAGGAIYLINSNLTANNLEVINCTATFGGAITSLNTYLNLTTFKGRNNRASYNGGALYAMYGELYLSKSTFDNNSASNGAALFVDEVYDFVPSNNKFTNNRASDVAGAVYSIISDGLDPFSVLDKSFKNTFSNNHASVNDDVYETNLPDMDIGGRDYILIKYKGSFNGTLPSSYDLRQLGQVTSVKNQGNGGNCWAFAALASLESCILKATGKSFDLSEENMKNLMSKYSDYGWAMETNTGGYDKMGIGYLVSWLGPVNESDDEYSGQSTLSPVIDSFIHVQNIITFKRSNYTDNDEIKKAIIDYGAVSTSICWTGSYLKGNNYYCSNATESANHAVVIVGWDDNYSKGNFKTAPPGNGAWIIKNSWGTSSGDKGYYYVSYYDTKLAPLNKPESTFTFILNDTVRYDKNYQYDIQGKTDYFLNSSSIVWYKNKFTATSNEYLAAVSTYFEKNTDWDLSIYVNDVLKQTKSGSSHSGYYTIDLRNLIPLKIGDVFEVVFKISVDGEAAFPISERVSLNREFYAENISYLSYDGVNWVDIYELKWVYPSHTYNSQVACIKAFTVSDKLASSITLKVNNNYNPCEITAYVTDQYGLPISTGKVKFSVDGQTITSNVVDGYAKLFYFFDNLNANSISATFTNAGYKSSSTKYVVNAKNSSIAADDLTVYYGKNINYAVKLVDASGNPVSGKNIKFNVNDVDYIVKTNSKGIATIKPKLGTGNYSVAISFADCYNNDHKITKRIMVKSTIILPTATKYTLNSKYAATLLDADGNPLKNTKVSIKIGKNSYSEYTDSSGKVSLNIDLAPASYTVSITNANNEVKTQNIKVIARISNNNNLTMYSSANQSYMVKAYDDYGGVAKGLNVSFKVNGNTYWGYTDEKGFASIDLCLQPGTYDITSSCKGYEASNVITVKTTINLPSVAKYTYNSEYVFTVLDDNGNPLKNSMVSFKVGDNTYNKYSDDSGKVSLKINLNPGSYLVSVTKGNEVKTQKITVAKRLDCNSAITMYYGAGKSYKVKAHDDYGNVIKNAKITFKVNGHTYYGYTNSYGNAYLKINLNPGSYKITATYKGYKVSNKIVVKPTLVMSAKTVKRYKTFKYNVKLLDKNGKILKYKKVTVKFRGKTYKVKTNSKGIATFKIKAFSKTGKFTLTASYGSAKISKKITVKK